MSCAESLGNLHASRQNNATLLILVTWALEVIIMSNGCPPGSRQIGGSGSSWSCFAHHKAAAKNNATGHTGEQPEAGTPAKPPSWHETGKTDGDWRGTSWICLRLLPAMKRSLSTYMLRVYLFLEVQHRSNHHVNEHFLQEMGPMSSYNPWVARRTLPPRTHQWAEQSKAPEA